MYYWINVLLAFNILIAVKVIVKHKIKNVFYNDVKFSKCAGVNGKDTTIDLQYLNYRVDAYLWDLLFRGCYYTTRKHIYVSFL